MQNDYYVYAHKNLGGNIFYIGKGRNKRAWNKSHRNAQWHEQSVDGYTVEMLAEGLTSEAALSIEQQLISKNNNLVNIRTTGKTKDYLAIDWKNIVEYSSKSPTYLVWKIDIGICDKNRKAGESAGSLSYYKDKTNKHSVLTFKGSKYYLHRVIWILFNGTIDNTQVINHLDNNPHNNDISNLELCSHAKNARSRSEHSGKLGRRNTSGYNGVTIVVRNTVEVSYAGYFYNLEGRLIKKSFSISKYGKEEAFRLACQWRKEQIEQLNANGAGYTDRHGT